MCSVGREKLFAWAKITVRKHGFLTVWDGSLLATPRTKRCQKSLSADYKEGNIKFPQKNFCFSVPHQDDYFLRSDAFLQNQPSVEETNGIKGQNKLKSRPGSFQSVT